MIQPQQDFLQYPQLLLCQILVGLDALEVCPQTREFLGQLAELLLLLEQKGDSVRAFLQFLHDTALTAHNFHGVDQALKRMSQIVELVGPRLQLLLSQGDLTRYAFVAPLQVAGDAGAMPLVLCLAELLSLLQLLDI